MAGRARGIRQIPGSFHTILTPTLVCTPLILRLCYMGLPERMLTVQYRMHPAIREFPSNAFYHGSLVEDTLKLPDVRMPLPR